MASQTGIFTATFDATPSVSPTNSVIALSNGAQTAYANFACLARFNPAGAIDARNGGAYAADSIIPYSPGMSYHFRLAVNIAAQTYSIYVTPSGSSELTVGTNFAFRISDTTLNWYGVFVDSAGSGGAGSVTVCNFSTGGTLPQAATPSFSPAPGPYSTAQSVSITTATIGAVIRYTTDGSMPSETAGTIYSGLVNISATTTLNAIAYASGYTDSTVASGIYSIGSAQTWNLVWNDEFNGPAGSAPDPSKWNYDTGGGGWGNNELEYYCAPTSGTPCNPGNPNISLDGNGNLVIKAIKDSSGNWTSGRMLTSGKFQVQYGRIEARIKLPVGAGVWPAFWMLGTNIGSVGWPTCGEQDIMEWVPQYTPTTTSSHIHGPGYSGANGIGANFTFPNGGAVTDANYHVYGVIWSANKLQFYRDDYTKPFLTLTPSNIPAGTQWVYNQPFFLLLNLAIGGGFPGNPNNSTPNPAIVLVDWVRVYQQNATAVSAINAGGPAAGNFAADTDFSGGTTSATTAAINTAGVTNPAPQAVYQSERYGTFTYTLPGYAAGSSHTVRLHFAEYYWTQPGQRVFNVSINGQQVLTDFDIIAAVGSADIAIVKEFTVNADSNGQYVIQFTPVVDQAKVSGIEIVATQQLQQVATPAFSLAGGTYTGAQNVAISDSTSGAFIYYTTDGSTPTTSSAAYGRPIPVSSGTVTIKAIGVASGLTNSTVASATYTINPGGPVATPTFSPGGGTYSSAQTVLIDDSTNGANIRFTTDGSAPSETNGTLYSGSISIGTTTTLNAIGYESGLTDSSIASALYTINIPQVAAPTFSPAGGSYPNAQSVIISDTTGGAIIRYTTDGSTPTSTKGTLYSGPVNIGSTSTLQAIASASGYTSSTVTSATYTIGTGQVAPPTFNPPGGTYAVGQTVTINEATAGASVYYSINGSAWAPYTVSISLPVGTSAVYAYAAGSNFTYSAIASATYTIGTGQVAPPTFNPPGGTYAVGQTVTINEATAGASVYYSINGSAWAPYTVSISLPVGTFTVYAYAAGSNSTYSAIASATYTIIAQAAPPIFNPPSGTYTSAQNVTITTSTSGASIRYTTNGSAPSATVGTIYSGPVNIGSPTTLNAVAYESGFTTSPVTSATYGFAPNAPATPSGLAAIATGTSTISVTWNSSSGATSYDLQVDGTTVAGVTSPYTSGGLATGSSHTFAVRADNNAGDSAFSASVSATTSNPTGPLPSFTLTGYWQNFNNGAKVLRISDVPTTYSLIVVAFANATTTPGEVTFSLDPTLGFSEAQFIADIATVQARGQHVIISVGGQNGAITVSDASSAAAFANSVNALIAKYGFEGVDIDLENGINSTYMAQALRAVKSGSIITMAPQTLDMQNTSTEYFKLALSIKDILTICNMQYYNSGSMLGYDGKVYSEGSVDFLTALATIQLENGLRPDQVGLGLPASTSAAGSGYVSPAIINQALNILATGASGGTFRPPHTYPTIRGAMTWSINWDASNGYNFANSVKAPIQVPPTIPAVPTGLSATANSTNQITVTWNASNGAASYDLLVDGVVQSGVSSPYVHTGLFASSTHTYSVRADNSVGDSAFSASVSATTQSAPTVPSVPAGLSATANNSSQITVTWSASAGATSYDLQVDGMVVSGVNSPYLNTGLSASSTHTYTVRADNSAGDSAFSAPVNATTNSGGTSPVTTTGTINFHLLLGAGSSEDSLTLTGDNYTDLIMSNTIAGVMYGHLIEEYYPGIQFNKDYLYGSLFGQLLQENIATQDYMSSSTLIDPSPNQQAVMGAGQGGPYQINNYAIDMVAGSYVPAGHSMINYIAVQKNIGYTMATASTQYTKATPPSFNNKYYGPMLCAYFHYNDLVALNVTGKGPGGWATPWEPAYDNALANFVHLPNSFLDMILNAAYNQGYYGGLVANYSTEGATATASTVASVDSYSSVWGNSSTYVQYPYQVHYYLDQIYDNPIPTTSLTTIVTPANHVAFNMGNFSNVFSNVVQTLAYSNGTNAAQYFTAGQAQAALNSALAQQGVSGSATLDLSNATDRAKIYAVIDSALSSLESTAGMKFNSTTNSQL